MSGGANTGAWLVRLLMLGLFCLSLALGWKVTQDLRTVQTLRLQQAELENVQYGLLDAQAWVDSIMAILDRKIRNLDLGPENRAALRDSFARMLDTLIREVDEYLRKRNKQGDWWQRFQGSLKQGMQDILVDLEDIRRQAPEFAEQILLELDKPGAREDLSRVLRGMLEDMSSSTFTAVDRSKIEDIQYEHQCAEVNFCRSLIETKREQLAEEALRNLGLLLAVAGLMLLIVWRQTSDPGPWPWVFLLGTITVLMAGGVLSPMLDVEARIAALNLHLLGEQLSFKDQVLYFQSKSVTDIVLVMVQTGEVGGISVGVLVMAFSVLFPLAKLAAALRLLFAAAPQQCKGLVRFFALKSSKWSMADVMVVAIIMAFLGFDGLMESQLGKIAQAAESVEVLTTNGTQLQPGFYLFFAFCMASLLSSTLLEKRLAQKN